MVHFFGDLRHADRLARIEMAEQEILNEGNLPGGEGLAQIQDRAPLHGQDHFGQPLDGFRTERERDVEKHGIFINEVEI
jgi:hypothetical protein